MTYASLSELQHSIGDLDVEIGLMRASIVKSLVAGRGTPVEQDGLQLVFRLEDEEGFGPWHTTHEPNSLFANPDLRWGVHEVAGFRDGLFSWGAHCFESKGFDVAAYLASGIIVHGPDIVFDSASAVRLGTIGREQFTTEGGFIAASGKPDTGVLLMDTWREVGAALGSTDGGTFEDVIGGQWYAKFPYAPQQAQEEALAAALYAAAGVAALPVRLAAHGSRLGVASAWLDLSDLGLADRKFAWPGFAADAWLANWDVAGAGNLVVQGSSVLRADCGGSLRFRARGGAKPFGPQVTDLNTLRDPTVNPVAAYMFAGIDIGALRTGVEGIAAVTPERISELVTGCGLDAELASVLIARRAYLCEVGHA